MMSMKNHERSIQIVIAEDVITYNLFAYDERKQLTSIGHQSVCIQVTDYGLLWDMSTIKAQLKDFVQKYRLEHASVDIVVIGPLVVEGLHTTVHHTVTVDELIPHPRAHYSYKQTLIGPYEDQYLFYTAGISRGLLLQLELLCIDVSVYLREISARFAAHIALYTWVKGSSYRLAEMIYDLDRERIDLLPSWRHVIPLPKGWQGEYNKDIVMSAMGIFLGRS